MPIGQAVQLDCADNPYWVKECLICPSKSETTWVVPTDVDGCLMSGINGESWRKETGMLAAISALIARHKSATTNALAAGVTAQGPATTAAVLASAADSPKNAAVAGALNDQLPAGTEPGAILPLQ